MKILNERLAALLLATVFFCVFSNVAIAAKTKPKPEPELKTEKVIEAPIESAAPSIEEQLYFGKEDLVTGPGKREMKLSEAPANVTIITHEDIVQSGAINLPDVFRRAAGMDVVRVTSAQEQVSIRGFADTILEGTRVAVLIDGRIFYNEGISSTSWPEIPVPFDDIKRIEIIKGPMSSLYGNKALLGIINIVTYDPEETLTLFGGGGGQYWLGQGQFIHAGKFAEGYWYKVTGNYRRYDELTGTPGSGRSKAEETLALTGKFQLQPVDTTRITLTGGITQSYQLLQLGGISPWDERRGLIDGRISHDMGDYGKLNFQTSWERHNISSKIYALGTQIFDEVDSELRHTVGFDVTKKIRNTLTYGANYRLVDATRIAGATINTYAGYLQDEMRFYDKVIVTGGVRADDQHNFAGLNISANGNVTFLIHPRYTLRFGAGTAFNTPTVIHYFLGSAQAATATVLGDNRTIKAERILSFDVGNTIRPLDWLTLRADAFYYRLSNIIVPSVRVVNLVQIENFYSNDGRADAIGGEFGVEAEFTKYLQGYANWSYERFTPKTGNVNTTPNLGNPYNKASGGLRGFFFDRRFTANVDFNFVQKHWAQNSSMNFATTPADQIKNLYLLNVRVAYWPIRDHLELAVAANNVLNNTSVQTAETDPTNGLVLAEKPRFNIWGSLKYQF